MRYVSYAQEYEDIVLHVILNDVADGFYIDVGGFDPVEFSVTKFFYEKGWHGINIEPITKQCLRFEEQRLRDINLCVGVSNLEESKTRGLPIFYLGGGSTFDVALADEKGLDTKSETSLKTLMTLSSIYRTYCHVGQTIHFCKIDVEGYERKVLEGIDDWNSFRPWVYVVEATKPSTLIPTHDEWENILLENGYMYAYHFCVNRYYIDKRKEHLLERVKKIDEFFKKNDIVRLRMYSRPKKKLKENIVVCGLGEEFNNNKNRILQRSYVIACTDNYRIPEGEFWNSVYMKPEDAVRCEVDKFLICTHKYFDEIKTQLVGFGVNPEKIIDIDGLRFDKL